MFVFVVKCRFLSFLNYRQVGVGKCLATSLSKLHPEFYIILCVGPFMIVKNTPYPTPLIVAVRVDEIIITFLFENRVKSRIKPVAYIFICLVKMCGIFCKEVIGCQVGAA